MFTKALEVIQAGFNGVLQNGVEFRIVGGSENNIYIRSKDNDDVLSIEVDKVQTFCKFQ